MFTYKHVKLPRLTQFRLALELFGTHPPSQTASYCTLPLYMSSMLVCCNSQLYDEDEIQKKNKNKISISYIAWLVKHLLVARAIVKIACCYINCFH